MLTPQLRKEVMKAYDIRRLYRRLMVDPDARTKFERTKRDAKRSLALIAIAELLSIAGAYPIKMLLGGFAENAPSMFLYGAVIAGFVFSTMQTVEHQFMDRLRSKAVYRHYGYVLGYSHEHQLSKDTAWHTANSTGEKESVLSKNMKKVDYLIDIIVFDVVPMLLTVLLVGIGLLFVGWQYSLWAIMTVVVYCLIAGYNEHKYKPWRKQAHELDKAYLNLGSEQIKNWPLIRNFGLVRRESEKYRATVDKYTHTEDERRKIRVKQWIVQNSVLNISTLSVGLYLVWMWKHGNVSVGNATLVILWFAKIYVDMYRFSNFQREVQEGVEALSELITMVETPSLITEIDNPVLACGLSGEINFENVSFAYEGNEDNALDSVTCVVPAGSTLAVVGESGSGKSTLVSMLLRDYDPVIGRISIGGVDLRHLSRTDYLQNMLAIVSQDPMLGDGTIASNIRFGRPHATDEEVIAAAKLADAHNFITSFPQGYDTPLGENGIRLSGGQKQRIAIAMALVKDPRILILDEATSSLDEPTQARVKANLDKRNEMRTCTNIVIAHRFSTIENADLVLLLDGGLVAGFGTIEELKESSALFRRLERQDYLDSEV